MQCLTIIPKSAINTTATNSKLNSVMQHTLFFLECRNILAANEIYE